MGVDNSIYVKYLEKRHTNVKIIKRNNPLYFI